MVSRGSSSWRLAAAFFPFVLLDEIIFRELMSTVFVVSVCVSISYSLKSQTGKRGKPLEKPNSLGKDSKVISMK